MKKVKAIFPPIGMRIFKSFLGVFLGFVIYFLRGQQGAPFYTALSVLWCVRPYSSETRGMAAQRTIGTFIGGAYGLIMILLQQNNVLPQSEFIRFALISLFLIPVLYTTVLINKKNASYFACVVFLSVAVVHLTEANPYIFVFNRVLDTLVGIGIGVLLNEVHFPRKKKSDVLFVSAVNDVLMFEGQTQLKPYTKVELNRLLDEGMKFTVCTMWTPGAVVELLRDVRISYPMVVMDGAALFDPIKNSYLRTIPIGRELSQQIYECIHHFGMRVFSNVIEQDTLFIYHDVFKSEVEEIIYQELRSSPYRNYLQKKLPPENNVVYFVLIDESSKIAALIAHLEEKEWMSDCRMVHYDSVDHIGYRYLKIYQKNATKKAMLAELFELTGQQNYLTIGTVPQHYDVVVHSKNSDETVRSLKKMYEPVRWSKNFIQLEDLKSEI